MLDDDKMKARKVTTPVAQLPPMPLQAEAISWIAARGLDNPANLSLTEIYHLCNAVVSASKNIAPSST